MKEWSNNISEHLATALPLSPEELAKYRAINRGEVQVSLLKDQESVLHITLPQPILSEDEAVIVNRWIYSDKGRKIQDLHANIPRTNVDVPHVTMAGNIEVAGQSLSYWLETFLPGISLTQATLDGVSPDVYAKIVEWLADYHQRTEEQSSLSAYFKNRFDKLAGLFSSPEFHTKLGQSNLDGISHVIDYGERTVEKAIGRDERVSKIHGDLRAENILIDRDRIGIIDFEQGVNGGDWYTDIEKLLMPSRDEKPDPTRPKRYRPPLEFTEKGTLLEKYTQIRSSNGWSVPGIFDGGFSGDRSRLQTRIDIFDIDNTLSSLTYRLIRQRQTGMQEDPNIQRLIAETNSIKNRLGV